MVVLRPDSVREKVVVLGVPIIRVGGPPPGALGLIQQLEAEVLREGLGGEGVLQQLGSRGAFFGVLGQRQFEELVETGRPQTFLL